MMAAPDQFCSQNGAWRQQRHKALCCCCSTAHEELQGKSSIGA